MITDTNSTTFFSNSYEQIFDYSKHVADASNYKLLPVKVVEFLPEFVVTETSPRKIQLENDDMKIVFLGDNGKETCHKLFYWLVREYTRQLIDLVIYHQDNLDKLAQFIEKHCGYQTAVNKHEGWQYLMVFHPAVLDTFTFRGNSEKNLANQLSNYLVINLTNQSLVILGGER